MTPSTIGIIGTASLFILIFSRMPVGYVMAIIGFIGFGAIISFKAALSLIAKDVLSVFSSYNLSVIPLFVLMGQLAFHTGISKRLFDFAYKFLGRLPGGLGIAAIGACAAFAAICGSTNATAATMAAATLPEMKRYNYAPGFATGVVAAGGTLGILIPPSVIFIVYGIQTEQSIGKLFVAGMLPGAVLTLLFVSAIIIWASVNPKVGPRGPKTSMREKGRAFLGLFETLLIFAAVMGGLFAGVFTPTEAGAVGAFFTLLIALFRRTLTWPAFVTALYETARITCMILMIVAGATIFGHFLAVSRIPYNIAGWVAGLSLQPWIICFMIIMVYFIGGCFIDALALMMLTVPIFYPVMLKMGYDPLWFGVVIVLITQIGVITPPVGINVYVVSGVARDVPLNTIFKGVVPLLLALILCVIILLPFPQLALYLPSLMK